MDIILLAIVVCGLIGTALAALAIVREVKRGHVALHAPANPALTNFDKDGADHA